MEQGKEPLIERCLNLEGVVKNWRRGLFDDRTAMVIVGRLVDPPNTPILEGILANSIIAQHPEWLKSPSQQ
jgi:hypothetical protein